MKVCKIERFLNYIDFLKDPTKSVEEKIVKIKEFENLKTDEEVLKTLTYDLFCLERRLQRQLLNEVFKNLGVPREKRKEEIMKVLVAQKEK